MQQGVRTFPSDQDFGDPIPTEKEDGVLCIGYANTSSLGTTAENNVQVHEVRNWISKMDTDIFGGVEPNINWRQMPWNGKLYNLFQYGGALCTVCGHNIHETYGRRQYGGTFILAKGEVTDCIADTGMDPSGLGRWSWMRFRGKHNVTA